MTHQSLGTQRTPTLDLPITSSPASPNAPSFRKPLLSHPFSVFSLFSLFSLQDCFRSHATSAPGQSMTSSAKPLSVSFVNILSKGVIFQYPERRADFIVPEHFKIGYTPRSDDKTMLVAPIDDLEMSDVEASKEKKNRLPPSAASSVPASTVLLDCKFNPSFLLRWRTGLQFADSCYVDRVQRIQSSNPQNWSKSKKAVVTNIIFALTFAVYTGSSLITSGFESLTEEFGIGCEEATVTLSIYVISYGLRALFFSPLSEIPAFGRGPFGNDFLLILICIGPDPCLVD